MPPAGRGVAQPGSASHWGCGGRWFESSRPDHHSLNRKVSSPRCPAHPTFDDAMVRPRPRGQPAARRACLSASCPGCSIFVIFYLLMIRPQQRRVKQHQAAIAAVKKGDEVVTGGGIRGRVTKVSDDEAEVEIAQGVKVQVVKSTLSEVLTPTRSRPTTDARFSALEGLAGLAGRRARRPAVDPEPDRRHAARATLAEVAAAVQDQPRPRPRRRKPLAARGRCSATRRSSASRRWRIRSRPSFAAIPRIDVGDISTAGGRLSFMVRDPTQVDAAVERMRNLTQPVAPTGNRDWDVQVIDSTRIVLTPTAERHRASAQGRDGRRPRRRSPPHRSRRHQGNHRHHRGRQPDPGPSARGRGSRSAEEADRPDRAARIQAGRPVRQSRRTSSRAAPRRAARCCRWPTAAAPSRSSAG